VLIGPHKIDPPLILAPMAGVTDKPFRLLCKRLGAERVTCVYRRSESECPARVEELHRDGEDHDLRHEREHGASPPEEAVRHEGREEPAAQRGTEHAAEGREILEEMIATPADADAVVAAAESAFTANWRLLDGV